MSKHIESSPTDSEQFDDQAYHHPLEDMPSFEDHMNQMSKRIEQMDPEDLDAIHERLASVVEEAKLSKIELDDEYRNYFLEKDGDALRITTRANSHIVDLNPDIPFFSPTPNPPTAPNLDLPSSPTINPASDDENQV